MNRKLTLLAALILCNSARAEDWPTWRHDAQHTGTGKQQLAAKLYLHWSRDLARQKTAWPDQPMMVFDRVCEPIVLGNTLFKHTEETIVFPVRRSYHARAEIGKLFRRGSLRK